MSFVHIEKEKKTSHKTRKGAKGKERKKLNWLPCQIINREDMGFCQG
jgi:hypothetical protein